MNDHQQVKKVLAESRDLFSDLAQRSSHQTWAGFERRGKTLDDRLSDNSLAVAMVALLKAGKSTFINSLLSDNLLPSDNEPCTACICQIEHTVRQDAEPNFKEETQKFMQAQLTKEDDSEVSLDPSKHILTQVTKLNQKIRACPEKTPVIKILAPFTALKADEQATSKSESSTVQHVAFSLLDTPGPNEFDTAFLRAQLLEQLAEADALIYLLDYTKLGQAAEADLFDHIKKVNCNLVSSSGPRLFFVVNKMDNFQYSGGRNKQSTQESVAKRVTDAMDMEDFQLKPENVFCISATEALLSRLCVRGKLTNEQQDQLHARICGKMSKQDPEFYKREAKNMFMGSGLDELEKAVMQNLYEERSQRKMQSVWEECVSLLKEAVFHCEVQQRLLSKNKEMLVSTQESLQQRFEKVARDFDKVRDVAGQIVQAVSSQVIAAFDKFDLEARDLIAAVFDQSQEPKGPLNQVWKKLQSLAEEFGPPQASRWQVQGHRAKTFETKIVDILADLQEKCREEMTFFYKQLESRIRNQQDSLFSKLNKSLKTLSEEFKEAIARELDVQMPTFELFTLEAQDARAFHQSFKEALGAGHQHNVNPKDEVRDVPKTRTRYKWTPWNQEYQQQYEIKETVTVNEESVTFDEKQSQEMLSGFMTKVKNESVAKAEAAVDKFIAQKITDLRQKLSDKQKEYCSHTEDALRVKAQSQGNVERTQARVQSAFNSLNKQLSCLQISPPNAQSSAGAPQIGPSQHVLSQPPAAPATPSPSK